MYQELIAGKKKMMVNLYLVYFFSITIPLTVAISQSIPIEVDTNELILTQLLVCLSFCVLYIYRIYSTPFSEFEKIQYRALNKKFEKSDFSNYSLGYVLFKKSTITRVWESFSPAGSKLATTRSITAKSVYKTAGAHRDRRNRLIIQLIIVLLIRLNNSAEMAESAKLAAVMEH